MRKGPILVIIGVVLAVISVPMVFAYTLYDERTVHLYEFDDHDIDEDETEYTYVFEDLPPGKITIRARDVYYGSGDVNVKISKIGGDTIDEYELSPGILFWGEEDTSIKSSGDYEIVINVYDTLGSYIELEVQFQASYSRMGLISALFGFPLFLIAGIVGISWGSVMIYRKNRGLEETSEVRFNDKYEGDVPYEDEKKEEWDEYETSPRRKELWFEPMTNPYDDIPSDYYSRKHAEGQAFSKRWHQRLGDEIEDRIKEKMEKRSESRQMKKEKKE